MALFMGLFDRFKEVDEFIAKLPKGLFKCNVCGMLSKNQLAMREHVIGFHKEYVVYKNKYKKIPEIATATWISIYYRILFTPPKEWSNERINSHLYLTRTQTLPYIIDSIKKIYSDEKFIGYANPILGVNPLFNSTPSSDRHMHGLFDPFSRNFFPVPREVFESLEKGNGSQYTFHRVYTVKGTPLNDNQMQVEFLIRFREGGWEGRRLEDQKAYTKEISPTEKLTYGYSPLDFIPDANMFIELDKALTKAFNIVDFKAATVKVFFNENGEPCVQARIGGTLYLEHRIIDRIKLTKEAPEIEKACFTDKGLDDFIKFEKNYVKKNKGKDTETIKEWLNEVNKIMKVKA